MTRTGPLPFWPARRRAVVLERARALRAVEGLDDAARERLDWLIGWLEGAASGRGALSLPGAQHRMQAAAEDEVAALWERAHGSPPWRPRRGLGWLGRFGF